MATAGKAIATGCISRDCKNKAFARGLCKRCYRFVFIEIECGAISERDAIAGGMILTPKKRGPKSDDTPMGKALRALAQKARAARRRRK